MRPSGITILHVRHASRVAAIASAEGPRRLLEAGIADALAAGGLPVEVVDVDLADGEAVGEVAASFAVADRIARRAGDALGRGRFVVALSGSCHTAVGSLAGIPESPRGVLWLDAHGDFNTPETTTSGLLDGTTLASITGRCWSRMCHRVRGFDVVADNRVALIGAREFDDAEASLLAGSGVAVIPPEDVPERAAPALRDIGARAGGVYVHCDLDVLDPSVGRANAYAVDGGLSTAGLSALLEMAFDACPVRVLGLASYDPAADADGDVCDAAVEAARSIGLRLAGPPTGIEMSPT